MKHLRLRLSTSLLGFLGLLAGNVFAEPEAGKVVFSTGGVQVERRGTVVPLAKDAVVEVGDFIITGADGHAHLRMSDQGFIGVRPGSRLHVEAYHYDAANPAASRVRIFLESGTSRTVSGRAGEAARERYRFNTPLAAIGLRGTDYVVSASPEVTRVTVLRGAVAVSPLGEGCSMEGGGACNGPLVRELSAATPHAYLEVGKGGVAPRIVDPENNRDAPSKVTPPHPGEGSAQANREFTSAQVAGEVLDPAAVKVPRPEIAWGRWSSVALPNTPTLVSQLSDDREITFSNELFGLVRPAGTPRLPTGGEVSMSYVQGEAYLRTAVPGGGALSAVALSNGRLDLDFNRRQFATSLTASTQAGEVYDLKAQGSIHWQGMLLGDPGRSNMNVSGALTNDAREAGYLFDARVNPTQTLSGATRWKR